MSITAARLQAEVGADTKGFDAGMRHADATVSSAPSRWGKALKVGAGAALAVGAAVVVRGVMGAISAGVASLKEQGVVVAQTNAVIRSTEGAAHVTAGAIRDLSNAVEDKTAIDDKAVQAGANMLLTFTNIRNEVGAGNDIFNQSVGILADMSTAMGTDMKGGAIQLGKALNDPLKGITALTRVGVTFSDQQKEQIKNFVEAGKTAEAQKVILAELNKEFGGSGAAFAATDAGGAAKFQDAIEGIQQAVAKGLLPAITRVRGQLDGFLRDPATIGQAQALGDAIAGIFSEGNLKTAASVMTTAAGAISTAIKLFSGLPTEVQALAVGAVALKKITGIGPLDIVKGAGGLIKMVFERGATPANPLFVADVAGGLGKGVGAAGGVASTGMGAASKMFLVGEAIGLALLVNEVRNGIADGNSKTATAVVTQGEKWLAANPTRAELLSGLAGITKGIDDIQANPLNVLVQGDALDQLKLMQRQTQGKLGIGPWANVSTGSEVYGPLTTAVVANTAALGKNTSAFTPPDAATAKTAQEADRKARGIRDTGPSKTLDPRFRFLAAGHAGEKDVAVANALAVGFERGNTTAFQSGRNLATAIRVLTADVKTVGKSAATAIGGNIVRLKAEQARRTAEAAAKIAATVKAQDLTANVTLNPAPINLNLNGRLVASATVQYTQARGIRNQ